VLALAFVIVLLGLFAGRIALDVVHAITAR
jgi:hypothetical protein